MDVQFLIIILVAFGLPAFGFSAMALISKAREPKAVLVSAAFLVADSHGGHHGYAVFENGERKAWGANQDAAIAAYGVSRAASTNR